MTFLIWDYIVIKFGTLTLRTHRYKSWSIFCIMVSLESKVGLLNITWVYRRTDISFCRLIDKAWFVKRLKVFEFLLLWLLLSCLFFFLIILVHSFIFYPVYRLLFRLRAIRLYIWLTKAECRFLICNWLRLRLLFRQS